MLSLVVGHCPAIIEKIEDCRNTGSHSTEICTKLSSALDRLSEPGLPAVDIAFVTTDSMPDAAVRRFIRRARSASPRTTIVIASRDKARQPGSADLALLLPDDLDRIGEILTENDSPAGKPAPARIELKLAEAQVKMQIILDRLTEGVAIIDAAGRIVSINCKLAELYDAPDASVFVGKPCHLALWGLPEPCDNCPRLAGADSADDCRELQIGDRRLVLDVAAGLLRNERGEHIGMIESIRDATPRLRLEEDRLESERMKAVGLMAAGLAHELRNPLTIISSIAEYCREKTSDTEVATSLGSIVSAAAQAEKVLRELLSFSRPHPYKFETVSTADLLRVPAEMIEPQCRANGIDLIVDVPGDLPALKADCSQLQRALLNFLLNGIEATGSGGTLTIAADASDGAVGISITDTGCGMTPQTLARVFEPFFTTRRGGVGLGMANARRIITAHRGEVTLESEPEKGTSVRITLPLARNRANAARRETDGSQDQARAGGHKEPAGARDRRRA